MLFSVLLAVIGSVTCTVCDIDFEALKQAFQRIKEQARTRDNYDVIAFKTMLAAVKGSKLACSVLVMDPNVSHKWLTEPKIMDCSSRFEYKQRVLEVCIFQDYGKFEYDDNYLLQISGRIKLEGARSLPTSFFKSIPMTGSQYATTFEFFKI